VTFAPPPPPGTPTTGNSLGAATYISAQHFPLRPKIWVPPLVAFGAFTSGYAIPWDFGGDQGMVIVRVVLPLVIAASFCLVAGFYTYRTLPGWRIWTWASFGAMMLNAIHISVLSPLSSPVSVQILMWLSSLLLIISATFGQEAKSDLHSKPTNSFPGAR
jgi:hypothetical protein